MKKALLSFSEIIGICSLRLVQVSGTALVGCAVIGGTIVVGRAIQSLAEPAQRVAVGATNIGAIGIAGLITSGVLYVCAGGHKDEEEIPTLNIRTVNKKRDERWEELVQDMWGSECNISSCRGCKHLVGRVAPGQFMVCGMHPYGKYDCPDWEEK